ncbi:Tetraspanin-8 [Collichthys lucidus]|uniref:Tetraspanin-8 n=1 Tax=Collichthys lucidus TaxID=240159 RepID=A0A4U5VR50_COLLU|nr:Tetraspanin-8 [Collichthys lucidus]
MAVNKCIKYLLFFFNLLFWISGCIILGVSIYLKVSKDGNQITNESLPGIDLMIAIGVIIMVLGFLGCCGAIKENRCMLLMFFVSLLVIFILLLAAGILGAVGEKKVKDWVKERLEKFTPLSKQPQGVKDDLEKLQRETCSARIITLMEKNMEVVIGIAFAIATLLVSAHTHTHTHVMLTIIKLFLTSLLSLQIFGMVFAMILYCQIGRKDSVSTNA